MRSEKVIKNSIIAIITNLIAVIAGMISQTIFLQKMGTEYLGINSLFSNIVSMLGIVELGLGSAIIYHLYKPIAERNKDRIKILLNFYKKCYRWIAIIVAIIGILILPFVNILVGDTNISINLYGIFLLFVLDAVMSYALTYKRSILYADQKTYVINLVHIGYIVGVNCLQILILCIGQNYWLYLVVKIVCKVVENIIINLIVDRKYSYLKKQTEKNLDKKTKQDIKNKVKGLLFHKISTYVVNSTDNITISMVAGVGYVGLYSNYYMIISALTLLINQMFSSIVATIGNLFTENDNRKNWKSYKNILFINFWIAVFCTISFLGIVQPFISIWIGKQYLLEINIVLMIALVFYFQTMRKTLNCFKEAGGIFFEDRFSALMEAVINLVTSIVLGKIFGMIGVFIGTIISSIYIYIYAYPKYVYMPIFNKTRWEYILENLKYFVSFCIIGGLTMLMIQLVKIDNSIYQVLYNGFICLFIPNIMMLIMFRNKEEFKYIKVLIYSKIKRI